MTTILVVDDEPQIAEIAGDYLRMAGFEVITAGDGVSALDAVRHHHPDLVVLDLGLPKLDGLAVARTIRRDSDLPIIMLTARVDEDDRLHGLEIGADDYITKPFSPRELVARVRAVLRRSEKHQSQKQAEMLRVADLLIDLERMRVTRVYASRSDAEGTQRRPDAGQPRARGEELIDLTPTEFQILAMLARHAGRVFTRAQLIDGIRGDGEAFDRAVDSHIKNIRRKLGHEGREYIATVYGIGYRFVDE